MERSTIFNGSIHYFYGHFQCQKLWMSLPGRVLSRFWKPPKRGPRFPPSASKRLFSSFQGIWPQESKLDVHVIYRAVALRLEHICCEWLLLGVTVNSEWMTKACCIPKWHRWRILCIYIYIHWHVQLYTYVSITCQPTSLFSVQKNPGS